MLPRISRAALAAFLLASVATALAHGDDAHSHGMDMDMDMGHGHTMNTSSPEQMHPAEHGPMSYFAYGKYTGWIVAHIALMVVAWCFVLPAGKNRLSLSLSLPLKSCAPTDPFQLSC